MLEFLKILPDKKGQVQGIYSHETALQIYNLSDLSPSLITQES